MNIKLLKETINSIKDVIYDEQHITIVFNNDDETTIKHSDECSFKTSFFMCLLKKLCGNSDEAVVILNEFLLDYDCDMNDQEFEEFLEESAASIGITPEELIQRSTKTA